jgi:hypothetical protein
MSEISITQAAFAGVRALSRRPATLLVWYVVMVLLSAFLTGAITELLGPGMAQMQALRNAGPAADPTAAAAVMATQLRGYSVFAPLLLIIGAITTGAANRLILRPEDHAFAYFRVAADELRLIVVLLVIGLITSFVVFFGLLLAAVVVGIAMGAGGAAALAADPSRALIATCVGITPALLLLIFLAVRLSVAPAQTVDSRRVNIFGSWRLTQGRFWPVFTTYLLGAVVYLIVYVVVLLAAGAVARSLGAPTNGPLMRIDASLPLNLTQPAMIVYFLLSGFVQLASLLLLVCPGAALYRQITGRGAAEVF